MGCGVVRLGKVEVGMVVGVVVGVFGCGVDRMGLWASVGILCVCWELEIYRCGMGQGYGARGSEVKQ